MFHKYLLSFWAFFNRNGRSSTNAALNATHVEQLIHLAAKVSAAHRQCQSYEEKLVLNSAFSQVSNTASLRYSKKLS